MSKVAPNTAAIMAKHWDERVDEFEQAASHRRLRDEWFKLFVQAIGPGTGNAIDLGCGTGACALVLAELGYNVTAVDGSSGMLAQARKEAATRGLAVSFVQSDMDSVSLPTGAADVVCIRNVLWTLERPDKALHVAHRLLRPGGTLFLSDGLWLGGGNSSVSQFGYNLPNFNGIEEQEARNWLNEAKYTSLRSWQHIFQEHPYGAKYDDVGGSKPIEFFVLTARAMRV